MLTLPIFEQPLDRVLIVCVMEVRSPCDCFTRTVECACEISEVAAIALDLSYRVQSRVSTEAVDDDQFRIAFPRCSGTPLLEFNDDIRRRAGLWVPARQDSVRPLGRQRQLVLQQHLDVAQTGLKEHIRQAGQASLPRTDLRRRRAVSGPVQHLLEQHLRQGAVRR